MNTKRSQDPLKAAITTSLWPFLKSKGFCKSTPNKFSREANGVLHRIIVDANGISKKNSTNIIYFTTSLSNPNVEGYLLGHKLADRSWNMSTHEKADQNMQEIVSLLEVEVLAWFSNLSSFEKLDEAFQNKEHIPKEPLLFVRALSKVQLGDHKSATEILAEILSGSFEAWLQKDSPANQLLDAIKASSTDS